MPVLRIYPPAREQVVIVSALSDLDSEVRDDIERRLQASGWRPFNDLYRRLTCLADSTGRADVWRAAVSVAAPVVLSTTDNRRIRREMDKAVRAAVEPVALSTEPLSLDAASVGSVEHTVELRSQFDAMRRTLTPAQQRVAAAMLELGTVNSEEVSRKLGIKPSTVRRHHAAIKLAKSV